MLSHLASAHLIPHLLPNKLENPSRSVRLSLDCQPVAFHEWEFFWPKDVPGVAKEDSSKLCKENTELQQSIFMWFETWQFFSAWLHSSIPGRGRLTPQCLELSSHPSDVRHCSDSRPFTSMCSPCHVWRSSDYRGVTGSCTGAENYWSKVPAL